MHEMTSELQMVLNEVDCTDVIPTGTFVVHYMFIFVYLEA